MRREGPVSVEEAPLANRGCSRASARVLSASILLGALAAARPAGAEPPVFGAPAPLSATAAFDGAVDGAPQLATDGRGTWLAVWESSDSLGGSLGSDRDVLFSRSTDGGETWSAPAPIDPGAAGDAGADREPTVAADGSGAFVVVWRSNDAALAGGTGSDFDLFVARSLDGGARWTAPAALDPGAARDTGSEGQAVLATDGAGTWIAAWQASGGLGGALGSDLDLLFARSTDAGATWSLPAPLHANAATDAGVDASPSLASDGEGGWIAVWSSRDTFGGTQGADDDVMLVRSTDGGASWSAPALVQTNGRVDSGWDVQPAVVRDAAGSWVVLWQSNDSLGNTKGFDDDVLVARSTDGASWSAPRPVDAGAASDASADTAPALASNGHGLLVAVWQANAALGGALGADVDLVMATSADGGASWSAPAAVHASAAWDAGADQAPSVASDGAARWVVAWLSTDSLGGTIGTDLDPLVAAGLEPALCGDGVVHPDEPCDDGNAAPGDGCRADCTLEICGDALLDPAEACDDGNELPGDGCRGDCSAEVCGDGVLDAGEACDDGNALAGDGCRSDCSVELCGDGVLDAGEACDDGNAAPGDGCDDGCGVEPAPPSGPVPDSLLDLFDAAVADGSLVGAGRGPWGEKRLRVLRRLLESAQRWLDGGRAGVGCGALKAALLALDGAANPPDLASGPAAAVLAAEVDEAMQAAGCRPWKAPRPPPHERHERCDD
jgi:cysteine-rich repeat protein